MISTWWCSSRHRELWYVKKSKNGIRRNRKMAGVARSFDNSQRWKRHILGTWVPYLQMKVHKKRIKFKNHLICGGQIFKNIPQTYEYSWILSDGQQPFSSKQSWIISNINIISTVLKYDYFKLMQKVLLTDSTLLPLVDRKPCGQLLPQNKLAPWWRRWMAEASIYLGGGWKWEFWNTFNKGIRKPMDSNAVHFEVCH